MTVAKELMAAIQLANDSYAGGYEEGWKAGARAGIAACRRIAEGENEDEVLNDLLSQGKSGSEQQ